MPVLKSSLFAKISGLLINRNRNVVCGYMVFIVLFRIVFIAWSEFWSVFSFPLR